MAVAVRFAMPDDPAPPPIALAAAAIAAVIAQCARTGCIPSGTISVSIGACRDLVGLWERLSQGEALDAASVGSADQVGAMLKGEPERFAALAFAHALPRAPA